MSLFGGGGGIMARGLCAGGLRASGVLQDRPRFKAFEEFLRKRSETEEPLSQLSR